ncbi:hypothetical protein ACTFIR_006449 [Dictyostelium discoideum]
MNGQSLCNIKLVGPNYNIVLNLNANYSFLFYLNSMLVLPLNQGSLKLKPCSTIPCGPHENTTVCATLNTSDHQLGNISNSVIDYEQGFVVVSYLNIAASIPYCENGYTTKIHYRYDQSKIDYDWSATARPCSFDIFYKSKTLCQKCPNCSESHGECNMYSGWCNCDQYTKGLSCDQLNASISSVETPTIDGGAVKLFGDFQNIFSILGNIEISIGNSICNQIPMENTQFIITCTIEPGFYNKTITLSDGNGATLSYKGFYYRWPCPVPFTPTFVSGGNVYLIGDFSNVFNRNLTIYIGDQQCRINNINQTVIECVIGPGEGFHNVTISINVILIFKTIDTPFEYKYLTCPLGCSLHGTCNKFNGLCDCNIGAYGNKCQFIECPLNCSTPNGVCDSETGICKCDDKHSGESCDFILCTSNCSTPNGVCDGKTGICNCDDKHSGKSCDFTLCPLNCSTPNGVCDGKTGTCNCDDKHSGKSCDFTLCPFNCSTPNGACDGKTGTCKCNNPYTGEACDLIIKCKQECSLKHGNCNTHTQDCICDTQTKGLSCKESRLLIESIESTNLDGGTTTIVGYFGRTTPLLTIKIGDSQCTNIKVFNDTTLNCFIGPGEGTHNVTITDDDLSFTAINEFQYIGENIKISKISGGAIVGITAPSTDRPTTQPAVIFLYFIFLSILFGG